MCNNDIKKIARVYITTKALVARPLYHHTYTRALSVFVRLCSVCTIFFSMLFFYIHSLLCLNSNLLCDWNLLCGGRCVCAFCQQSFSSIFQIVRALFGWPFVISIIFNSFANKPKINVSFHLFCMFLFNYIAFYRLL